MIEKTFTEGISLQKEGPKSTNLYKSSCLISADKSYCTSVYLAPKLVPKRTYYTVDETLVTSQSTAIYNEVCSLSTGGDISYESSISLNSMNSENQISYLKLDCDLPYSQNLELEPRLIPKNYSETINSFPKDNKYDYSSSVFHDPCFVKEHYIVGVKVEKAKEILLPTMDMDSFTSSVHIIVDDTTKMEKVSQNANLHPERIINGI